MNIRWPFKRSPFRGDFIVVGPNGKRGLPGPRGEPGPPCDEEALANIRSDIAFLGLTNNSLVIRVDALENAGDSNVVNDLMRRLTTLERTVGEGEEVALIRSRALASVNKDHWQLKDQVSELRGQVFDLMDRLDGLDRSARVGADNINQIITDIDALNDTVEGLLKEEGAS